MKPQTLIIRTAGTNCDRELAHAFELADASAQTIHLNELIEHPDQLERFDLIGFPGGFSYGDDVAAGRLFANRLRHRLYEPLQAAIDRGVPIIGICNGFQVLVKLGLLPDPKAGRQTATLADNATGRFIDRWVPLTVPQSVCIWTKGLDQLDLPIAHGEGRFVPESDETLQRWRDAGQIALRYERSGQVTKWPSGQDNGGTSHSVTGPLGHSTTSPDNPNGSIDDIAGICDSTGVVLGLMPHPERFTHPTQHPQWSRRPDLLTQTPAGLRLFQNAVEHVRHATVTAGS